MELFTAPNKSHAEMLTFDDIVVEDEICSKHIRNSNFSSDDKVGQLFLCHGMILDSLHKILINDYTDVPDDYQPTCTIRSWVGCILDSLARPFTLQVLPRRQMAGTLKVTSL